MQRRLEKIGYAAQLIGISVERAYELARLGILPVVRLDRQVRVDPVVLEEWLRSGGKALPGGWRSNARHGGI